MVTSPTDSADVGGQRSVSFTIRTSRRDLHLGSRAALSGGEKAKTGGEQCSGGNFEGVSAVRAMDRDLPPLRSINNDHMSFVEFVNTTEHKVTLYWIDYQGRPVSYGVMLPGASKFMDTFVTHPWIFIDSETEERYTVNQKFVFFPEPWFARYRGLPRDQLPQRCERTKVYITLPLYSLRGLSMRTIKKCLACDSQALELEIPRHLQFELVMALPRKKHKVIGQSI